MRLPRDLSGAELVRRLQRRYDYELLRQRGSHIRLVSRQMGHEHHVTVPRHRQLNVGTLASIISDVANYLEIDRDELSQDLLR